MKNKSQISAKTELNKYEGRKIDKKELDKDLKRKEKEYEKSRESNNNKEEY